VAAAHGVPEAQLRLGRMLLDGTGMARNPAAAFAWFERAARRGDAEALNMLGRCHENGWGTSPDAAAAARCYGKAAALGDAWAQYKLGHARAMNLVGRCHEQGWGTVRDPAAAAPWYRRSAEGGYFRGQYNHATVLIAAGKVDEARHWLCRAAETGTEAVKLQASAALAALPAEAAWTVSGLSGHRPDPIQRGHGVVGQMQLGRGEILPQMSER
jgi:TPR repeat protein